MIYFDVTCVCVCVCVYTRVMCVLCKQMETRMIVHVYGELRWAAVPCVACVCVGGLCVWASAHVHTCVLERQRVCA